MNFGDLKSYAFDFLKSSPAQGPWTDVEMARYIQDGHSKMHGMVADTFEHFFAVTTTLDEVSGTDLISLPTDLYRVLSIERIGGGQSTATNPVFLSKIDRTPSDIAARRYYPFWYVTDGRSAFPMFYYAIGQKQIRLVPIPANSLTASLRLTYIYRPVPLSADTDVPFQQSSGTGGSGKDNLVEFHDIIPLYAVEACLLTPGEENPGLAQSIQQRRLERENELKTYLSRINLQANKSMEVTEGVYDYD